MKNIIIVGMLVLLTSCLTQEEKLENDKKIYFLDENFILVNKYERNSNYNNGIPITIRTWVIMRDINTVDSVEIAEINTIIESDYHHFIDSYNFIITDSLWYLHNIGDKIHFDYILKKRFYKKPLIDVTVSTNNELINKSIGDNEFNGDLKDERELMELERQLLSVQRRIDDLKNQ